MYLWIQIWEDKKMEATKERLYNDISSVFTNAIETVRTKDDCTLTDMYV